MRNGEWSSNKVHVSSKLPKNPALGYFTPDVREVAVEIEADDPDFMPSYGVGSNEAALFVNIPEGQIKLPKGSCVVLDCGVFLDMPPGYKCSVAGLPGLFISLLDGKRVKVHATNLNDDLILSHKQTIGKIWVEPVYFFEWITKG